MIEDSFKMIVGLDPSLTLLRAAKARLNGGFYPILGVAENLPIRDECIAAAITCYSLRDVRDKRAAVFEFARVVKRFGRLEIVDVGKPNGSFLQGAVGVYIAALMPVIARLLIGRRLVSNPFRMIIPTFNRLSTNDQLLKLLQNTFGSASLHNFLFGGLVIVEAEKSL